MQDKIKLYEELLAADPGSRLFLSLARLYLEHQEKDKAVSTLETGLTRYPEHFEARLLLHATLQEQGRTGEAQEHLRMVSEVLRKYPAFWEHWAANMESEGQADAAAAVRFLARYFQDQVSSWGEILLRGTRDPKLEGKTARVAEAPPEAELGMVAPSSSGAGGGTAQEGEDGGDPYRTKTMADILSSQGDYAQALDIYSELQAASDSQEQREKLQERIDWVKRQIEAASGKDMVQGEEEPSSGEEMKLLHRLERLAERLEARG
ncbi:MAG: hypothetical protein K9K39_00145 [Desulfohalobiaceae bacterium]|nr:hypothetical protein [Desulfohalobiaceae bacterium]